MRALYCLSERQLNSSDLLDFLSHNKKEKEKEKGKKNEVKKLFERSYQIFELTRKRDLIRRLLSAPFQ